MTFSLSNFFYVNYETAYDIKKEVSHILSETGISLCLSAKLRPQGLIGYEYIHRPGQGIAGFHHLTASIDFILFHCHMYLKASLRCFLCVICLIPVWFPSDCGCLTRTAALLHRHQSGPVGTEFRTTARWANPPPLFHLHPHCLNWTCLLHMRQCLEVRLTHYTTTPQSALGQKSFIARLLRTCKKLRDM